eukprot:2114008-Rhodomonas_salina.1
MIVSSSVTELDGVAQSRGKLNAGDDHPQWELREGMRVGDNDPVAGGDKVTESPRANAGG